MACPSVLRPSVHSPRGEVRGNERVGSLYFGRFHIRELFDVGARWLHYRAFDRAAHREVSLHLIDGEGGGQLQARLTSAVELLRDIDLNQIVRPTEVLNAETPAFISPLARGQALARKLRKLPRKLRPQDVFRVIQEIALALKPLHEHFPHGQLSFQNILFGEREVLIADTIYSLLFPPAHFPPLIHPLTAPEVAEGHQPTLAADVFSLGRVSELLCSQLERHGKGAARLVEVLEVATATDPNRRFQNLDAFLFALERVLHEIAQNPEVRPIALTPKHIDFKDEPPEDALAHLEVARLDEKDLAALLPNTGEKKTKAEKAEPVPSQSNTAPSESTGKSTPANSLEISEQAKPSSPSSAGSQPVVPDFDSDPFLDIHLNLQSREKLPKARKASEKELKAEEEPLSPVLLDEQQLDSGRFLKYGALVSFVLGLLFLALVYSFIQHQPSSAADEDKSEERKTTEPAEDDMATESDISLDVYSGQQAKDLADQDESPEQVIEDPISNEEGPRDSTSLERLDLQEDPSDSLALNDAASIDVEDGLPDPDISEALEAKDEHIALAEPSELDDFDSSTDSEEAEQETVEAPTSDPESADELEKTCPKGMRLISKRGLEICIDRYEFPGKGQTPQVHVSHERAEAICGSISKRLCTLKEWQTACGGAYPYGAEYDPERCHTDAPNASLNTSGVHRSCRHHGVYDLSGNVAEWVAEKVVVGGSHKDGPSDVSCSSMRSSGASSEVGFRCCAEPIVP